MSKRIGGACAGGVAIGLALMVMLPAGLGQSRRTPTPPAVPNYRSVTEQLLRSPADGDWLMIRRTYDGWGFSPLRSITTRNIGRMRLMWAFATGENSAHSSPPVVNNGVMFVTTPNNQVIAIEAKTGRLLWRYRREREAGAAVPHETNRGVALYGDKVYFTAGEGVLIAIDARTGREAWAVKVADNKAGYYTTLAPVVAGGKVMIGASGGEFGIRGFIAAYDPETGKEAWRTYTIPAPGEPGSETWPKGDQWKTGGGSVWVSGNYDPETNLAYWGTGNGGPWMGDQRPGDNLYTASTLALDVATGAIRGHFQYNPNDSWDWDEVSPPILVDYKRGARTVKGLVNVARNGYVWFLERGAGPIKFVDGKPYVHQNVYRGLDPVSGRPDVDPAHKPVTGKRVDFCPSLHGGKNWPPVAFSPLTRLVYIPVNNNLCGSWLGIPVQYKSGEAFMGAEEAGGPYLMPGADHVGEVQAWNVDTGQRVWTHNYANTPNWGSMLATAGGLVFTGGTNDRKIHAFDAANGKLVWEYPLTSGAIAPPTSFAVDGKQYIAVHSGWGVDSRFMQGMLNRAVPGGYPDVPEGGAVWVFSVD